MDPQKLSQLDPKLRDAYQRVMGTPIPQPQTVAAQAQTPPPAESDSAPVDGLTPFTSDPTPAPTPPLVPEPEPAPPETTPPVPESPIQASNFVQMNSEVTAAPTSANFSAPIAQAQTVALKKKHHLMPILAGVVILIFLVIYSLFWAKIFNLKLPF